MITAIEANILLNALVPNEKFYEASVMALESAATSGSLVVCDLVYAELCTYFPSRRECDAFLAGNEIRVGEQDVARLSQARWPADADSGGLPDWGACPNAGAAVALPGSRVLHQALPLAGSPRPLRAEKS
jgi:hypothetical protein